MRRDGGGASRRWAFLVVSVIGGGNPHAEGWVAALAARRPLCTSVT